MIEALGQAVVTLLRPETFLMLVIATIIGLVIGIIPGIAGMFGLALLLPIVYRLPTEIALSFLIGFHAVTYTGGGITAILINIPGIPTAAASLLDGYPMTQKGEGGRALGAQITACTVGGILPVFMALAMIPLILPIILAFKSAEVFLCAVLGLSCLAVLTGGSATKGIISGCFGLALAMLGFQGSTGIPRFTFGSLSLYEGINIVVLAMGIFGLAEMIDLVIRGVNAVSQVAAKPKYSQVLQGAMDVYRHKWLFLRCTVIGYVVGIIPGVGAEASSWFCYAHAKQTSRHPELFGTGTVEGVIAPESASNAKEAGDLLTTMAFGIPGGAGMALMLGAFLMVGVTPGPRMMIDHLPLAMTLLVGIALANIIGGIIAAATGPHLARVSNIHIDFLFPIVVAVIVVAAFVVEKTMFNVILTFIFGLLGLAMRRFGYPRPAFLLGFVLGGLFEKYLVLGVKFGGPLFFVSSPLSIVLVAIIIFIFALPFLLKLWHGLRAEARQQ